MQHFNLDKENLQFLALQVATAARCLHKQLERNREQKTLDTDALMDITRTLAKIKPLICWLDRPPFKGGNQYLEVRKKMLNLAVEIAFSAQRDRFALKPVAQISKNAETLANLCDYIIQEITDPMLLQPASLILVTLKKKECDLGFYVSPSFHGIYRVTDIKLNSPAHISGKIEEGDEVVQINYQTVIGWQHKKVLLQLHDSKPDVLLTMKKRPKHVKIYGQIYMKPYRLPSKKHSMAAAVRWGEANSPILSRPLELLPSARMNFRKKTRASPDPPEPIPEDSVDGGSGGEEDRRTDRQVAKHEDSDSDLLTPTAKLPDHEIHLLFQTSRPFLQRRNTVCGDQSESFKYLSNVKFWQDRREKSFSMGFGLEATASNKAQTQSQPPNTLNLNGSMPDILTEATGANRWMQQQDENMINCDINKRPVINPSKSVRFDPEVPAKEEKSPHLELSAFDAIPFTEREGLPEDSPSDSPTALMSSDFPVDDPQMVKAKNEELIQQKTNLQRFPSDDQPPAIEPRKEQQVAPVPPPRPKKPIEMSSAPPTPPKPVDSPSACKSQHPFLFSSAPPPVTRPPAPDPPKEDDPPRPVDVLELVTPHKQKTLTLKKKISILAKRRKVSVKSLPHSDIQGHLYRRTKDKSGTAYWAKGYFVLADDALYCFRTKDAVKADFLAFLTGFTVSVACEIHSKPFAFKVYHEKKTLYFAAECQEALKQWLEYLKKATTCTSVGTEKKITEIKEIFTETESSEEDAEDQGQESRNTSSVVPEVVKHEKNHLGFGPLKFNNPFSSHKGGADKKNNDLPIPSAQHKTYIRVPGYAALSPGNHFFPPDSSLCPPSSSTPLNTPGPFQSEEKHRPIISPITPGTTKVPSEDPPPPTPAPREDPPVSIVSLTTRSPSKKFQPHNYIHASNPNLVDFECHLGEKPSTFSYETSGSSLMNASGGGVTVNGTNGAHSLQMGGMTLMDLMLQQQADDAKEVYNNRVFLGEEKEDEKRKQRSDSHKSENHLKITYGGDQKIDKIQRRTLPKTPDYAQSFKPDDVDILMIRTKEGQSLRNFGYEFISEEDPPQVGGSGSGVASREKRNLSSSSSVNKKTDKVSPTTSRSSKKALNWINSATEKGGHLERTGSLKNKKGLKFDSLKSTERFFSFNKIVGGGGYDSKKSSSPGQSPSYVMGGSSKGGGVNTLPLLSSNGSGSSKRGTRFNLSDGGVLGVTKKSSSSSAEAKERKLSSASTASYFSKLPFSSGGSGGSGSVSGRGSGVAGGSSGGGVTKEKKIFGSPRLHRAIFGRVSSSNHPGNRSPIFDEVILGQGAPSWMDTRRVNQTNMPDVVATGNSNTTPSGGVSPGGIKSPKAPEYPGMECPPVFRPQMYSLSDPSTSNTLRRRNNLNSKKSGE